MLGIALSQQVRSSYLVKTLKFRTSVKMGIFKYNEVTAASLKLEVLKLFPSQNFKHSLNNNLV